MQIRDELSFPVFYGCLRKKTPVPQLISIKKVQTAKWLINFVMSVIINVNSDSWPLSRKLYIFQ